MPACLRRRKVSCVPTLPASSLERQRERQRIHGKAVITRVRHAPTTSTRNSQHWSALCRSTGTRVVAREAKACNRPMYCPASNTGSGWHFGSRHHRGETLGESACFCDGEPGGSSSSFSPSPAATNLPRASCGRRVRMSSNIHDCPLASEVSFPTTNAVCPHGVSPRRPHDKCSMTGMSTADLHRMTLPSIEPATREMC